MGVAQLLTQPEGEGYMTEVMKCETCSNALRITTEERVGLYNFTAKVVYFCKLVGAQIDFLVLECNSYSEKLTGDVGK